ncbi:hypothetical protein ABTY59_31660 [Streptomyces sp. NPDC096079]|uniref:hypothetical protein n=1 Tax=Streptomyces sp. NPDC096079 TaxID=3155820 RepID=UPI00331A4D60
MLNRPDAARAELQAQSGLETKAARRKWNPALHPRDSKGRFIETGGTVRLWGGKLARVVRALPNDRILVQDQSGPNEFRGRRHTTSAKWVSMVARPDGTAPTDNEQKVQEEDARRLKNPSRGNGAALDDDGDPTTPNDPHDVDDQGRPIGVDGPDGPPDDDDEDEPADGRLPVNVAALPNKRHNGDGRFDDIAAVRQHFLDLADAPGQSTDMAEFLRFAAGRDDLQTTDDGRLVILMDLQRGGWYLTAAGTGQRMNTAGTFDTPQHAARFARHLERTAPTDGSQTAFNSGFDFSDPDLDTVAKTWRSSQGENIAAAIKRARTEFSNGTPPAARAPKADSTPEPEAQPLEYDWAPENLITVSMPAAVAEYAFPDGEAPEHEPDIRKAYDDAKRGRTGVLKITAPVEVHELLIDRSSVLAGDGADATPAETRGYRKYIKDVDTAAQEQRARRAEQNTPEPPPAAPAAQPTAKNGDTVNLTPDEVNEPAAAARAAKAPSAMGNSEIRDEIVSLMEKEMADGGLSGVDRTRMTVLEAEEARRAGRKPKEEPKPKAKTPTEEPGGLFDAEPDQQQRHVPDPNNPHDVADDAFGTPDLFAAAEGRDTSRLRPVQTRAPQDFQQGDRFVDTDGRTHTVAQAPIRTGRGRIRVVDEDGREHFLSPDTELRVLAPDEAAPAVPDATPTSDGPDDVPEGDTPTPENTDAPEADSTAPEDTDVPENAAEPADTAAVDDQVVIDHSGTGTVVRFPTPNGTVTDGEFAALRSLGFKASRDRSKPRFFYLPSNMTLSLREDRVRRLKEWLDGRSMAYQSPKETTERPELSTEQLAQLEGRHIAPVGTWALTDFQPGDEVWTGLSWDTVDSLGPKNIRLQSRGSVPYDRILARRRGGEIRTMLDTPADDGTPRPGTDDPNYLRDEQIAAELDHLRAATLPDGSDPTSKAVRRQVAARIRQLDETRGQRAYARRRAESDRRDRSAFVRDPARLAAKKGEQVQGRDGALIGAVYQEKKGKWTFADRDGRVPGSRGTVTTYTSRAAAITALNKHTDLRNDRSGEGWKYTAWDDVQAGDTIRLPELGRTDNRRVITGWSEPFEVSQISRGENGQIILAGRRGDEDVELEVPHTDATFGATKPGTVPERERSAAGDGMPWQQMTPNDFGRDERPTPAGDQNAPRPADEFGTPDLFDNGTPDTPEAAPEAPEAAPETPALPRNENETARAIRDRLPDLPPLPKLTGLNRQDKDTVRRIRGDYARILESLNGIVAENPPTGDAREDLRRVRENLDYIAERLTSQLLPDSEQARTAQASLYDLGQDLDRIMSALPERTPQPQGDGPNGGTLFRPWDLQDGDLVRFDAVSPSYRSGGLAPYFGSFRSSSTSSGDHGSTLVTYQGREWNDDRQQWEPKISQDTVIMPPRGLVERFTEEEWDAWRRPQQSQEAPEAPKAPPAPIGAASPRSMSNEEIEAELEALQAWQDQHVSSAGEGPRVEGNRMLAIMPVGNRRGDLWEEQRLRAAARRDQERKEKAKQERAAALARTEIGQRNGDGSYPISVDGNEAGTARRLGREWSWTNTDGDTAPELYGSRTEAAVALVGNVDIRRKNAAERDRGSSSDASRSHDDRAGRARSVFDEGMNVVGGESLPEMQELDDRLGRADTSDDQDAELRDVADRMDELAEQYELAGPQGELAADRFRQAARIARGEEDDRRDNDQSDDGSEKTDTPVDGDEQQSDAQRDEEKEDGQEDDESRRQRRDGDADSAGPDGEPDGGGAGTPEGPDKDEDVEDDPEGEQGDDPEDDDEKRRRRRRRRRDGGGNGGPGGGGPGGPGLPHLNLPDFDGPSPTGGAGDGGADAGDRGSGRRHPDTDSLRSAWRNGEGLSPAEDTPERRARLADLADREGLALSPDGGLATYPETQGDGTTLWRFTQARNGSGLPGITLTSDNPDEALELAGRFEDLTDPNGDPFEWHQVWDSGMVAAWRDSEGRSLPEALRAVRDDYEQERAGAFSLPEDLTALSNDELEAVVLNGLGPEDMQRLMDEMDRRDDVDARVRAAVPNTPPANAEEEEARGLAMDEAFKFGDTDVTQPTVATPGRMRREFDALDEERYQAAMDATGGRMLSPEAEEQGVDPRAVFSGRKYTKAQALELASPELRLWIEGDEDKEIPGNGRLTYAGYRQRETDRALYAEFAEWDEARYRLAIDATNGYFLRREYKYGGSGFTERDLFSGGNMTARNRWRQYASEELQEWFDANGGRQTFADFKQARRDGARAERHQYEEEQKRATEETPAPAASAADIPAPAGNSRHDESEEEAAFRYGGRDRMQEFADRAEVRPGRNADTVWLDGRQIGHISNIYRSDSDREPLWDATPFFGFAAGRSSRSRSRDTAVANLVVRALQDGPADPANPNEHMWDSVKSGLAGLTHELPDLPPRLQNSPEARARHDRLRAMIDAFRAKESPSGDLRQDLVQARDDFAWLRSTLPHTRKGGPQRNALDDLDHRVHVAHHLLDGFGPDSDLERPRSNDPQGDDDTATPDVVPTPDVPEAAPEPAPAPSATPDPEADPDPIGGQPAHWARVEDLVPGDMVRMNGTTRQGRRVQRAGYVGNTGPVLVDVTRRGRTEQMWRTWVTEHPDGTGESGNVFTSANSTAARAEAPDNVVPGSPASGAQSSLRSGDLPNQVPADRDGRGLFPGSTVSDTGDREGTVTGATDTTVAVRWSDGNDDAALSPTTLTVTDGQRPDGWTPEGQRVTPSSVVSDSDGALLGPVDDVDGDDVTITTEDGAITRSAGDLRVTGEVRDEAPDTGPVTGIDEPAAGDLQDGDVVLLDLDGNLTTVAITGTPERDGDRVTLQYADTTTGEIGEIDVDARAVLPRAQGPDGGAPDLGPDDAPEADDDLTIHPQPRTVEPVTGPTVDPELDSSDRDVIGDHADGPDDDPDAHQAAVRISSDLPVTPQQAAALAAQLRATADPSMPEGRAALRAADHLDHAAGRTPPAGFDRPRPSNVARLGAGDLVALRSNSSTDPLRVYRVIDAIDAPGGIRSLQLENEDGVRDHRIEHGAMPVWLLPEAQPDPVTPPEPDDTTPEAPNTPAAPATPDTPTTPDLPIAQVRPGSLRAGDVIDAPVSRTGYQLNGHRKLTIISEPQRNGWWMQLTGIDEDGNVHDFGLHSGRAVNVYDRNRPTPALPTTGTPRDPNQAPQADTDRLASDHARSMAARIIGEAIAGTDPAGDIHALREQIAQRLTREALADARQSVRRDGIDALDATGLTGDDRAAALRRLRDARQRAHTQTVKAALRTINDLEPLPGESDEDLAARARDLLRLIPDQIANRQRANAGGDAEINRAVDGHVDEAVNALMEQLQGAGLDAGDAERIARILAQQMGGSRRRTARRIASRVAAASPAAGREPGLLAKIVALLIRLSKRLVELVKAAARKIAEKYRDARERMARMRAFLGRMVQRVRQWPESRRLARLHRAVNLPDADGDTLAARVSHWAGLMPETGRFGQSQRRVTFWRPSTWRQLAAGRLPERSDRIQWTRDRAADGGPGLTGLRHMAALRAAGTDVDQDVTRRLAAVLGDDFGDNPHDTLQHADDYIASSERRLVNLQAARSSGTIPDDPDLEIELHAARIELSAARREYADLRARYAAAVPDAVAASLGDIREMGPQGIRALVFGPDTDPEAERALRGVERFLPRAWFNIPQVRGVTAVDGSRGRYEQEGQRITVADLADEGRGTAGYGLAQHLARYLEDLDVAQRMYWFSRTHTGRPGARRMRPSALDRLLRRQQTQPETGDTLAQSIQAMFSGDWYQDDDLRAFLLGLMATR